MHAVPPSAAAADYVALTGGSKLKLPRFDLLVGTATAIPPM
jgi:hypothetical protein